jgi:hypothetical protein
MGGDNMKEYTREYSLFSLCGVNCGLCPRYHTNGNSKCPGCGGQDFHLKHPTCSVITCNQKHDNVEYCFQCSSYPCKKYDIENLTDFFITHQNVITDFEKTKSMGISSYQLELNEKVEILKFLIDNYNDGRRKNFYCIAINLLKLSDIKEIIEIINTKISMQDIEHKNKIAQIVSLFEAKANEQNIKLALRK